MKTESTLGLTLIEILVAIVVFAVVVAISSSILASLSVNAVSKDALSANESSQQYLEYLADLWSSSATYGLVDATTAKPSALTNYKWSVKICDVDLATSTPSGDCTSNAIDFSQDSTTTPIFTSATNVRLIKVAVKYAPLSSKGKTISVVSEIAKK